MKKQLLFTILSALAAIGINAQVFWTEDFETDGEGVRYNTVNYAATYPSSVFYESSGDHFGRVTAPNVSVVGTPSVIANVSGNYSGQNGSVFVAGEDMDDTPNSDGVDEKIINITGIDIAGKTNLAFKGLFAAGNANAPGSNGYDNVDYIKVTYQIDGGGYNNLMWFSFERYADNFNEPIGLDMVFDGEADVNGTNRLGPAFQEFSATVTGTGSILDLRVEMHADGGNEELAYDFLRLEEVVGPPTPTISLSPASISGLNYEVSMGPSAIDSFVVTATSITGPVTMTAGTDFEISLDNLTYGVPPAGVLILADTALKVYVRLKAVLAVNTYSESITFSSAGAVDKTVVLSGAVTAPVPDIIINEIHADPSNAGLPAGDANGDGFYSSSNDEFVELFNNEAMPVDISGATLSDGGGVKHTFPPLTVIPAGEFMTVFGGGTAANYNGVGGLFMAAIPSGLSLNNGGDDVVLKTSAGTTIDSYTYNGTEGGGNQSIGLDPDFTGSFVLHTTIVAAGRLYSPGVVNVSPATFCSISTITAGTPTACVPATNTYSVDITVTYTDPPATGGNIEINGQPFSVTGSPQTVTLSGLPSSGVAVDVTAVFSDDGTCTYTETGVYTAPASCLPTCQELFISEYIEGSSSNKCFEIYNPTANDIDMAAGGYSVAIYGNGSITPNGGSATALSGIIPAYGTYVICNSSAIAGMQDLADSVGGAYNSLTFFNGDDAFALTIGGADIDVIGQIGNDPGSSWSNGGVSTANQTLSRNAAVLVGDNSGSDSFDPSLQWANLGNNDFSNLGQHNSDCAPFVWTGLTSTDYHTGSNWTKGTVPTATDHAWIPTAPVGGVFPIASADVNLTDLTIRSGASFNMAPTFGLTFSGTATNSGTVTLESSASGTAWLDEFTNAGTYVGDITVQTYISTGSGLGQRYFGSPVASGVVSGLDGTYASGYSLGQITPTATCDITQLAAGSAYSNLFQWNENATFSIPCVQEGWEAISASSNLQPGRGYSGWVNDGSIISISGAPNSGNISYSTSGASFDINNTNSGYVAGATGWHVLSNPYASPLNVDAVMNSGFASVQIYNGGSGPYSGTFLPALVTSDVLPIMQGFVAQSGNLTGETFNGTNALRVPGNQTWQRPDFGHMLTVDVEGNGMADKTYLYFKHDANDAFDAYGDCKKRESSQGHPTLYTSMNGDRMSLNGLSSNHMNRSVDLGLLSGSNGTFTLSFDGLTSFPATSLIFLEDNLTGDFVNIREVAEYSFTTNVSDDTDRFVLHFTSPIEITSTPSTCSGADAAIVIDFGQNVINNNVLNWDYSLVKNASIVNASLGQNGLITISDLDQGSYDLILQNGSYTSQILIEIEGAARVAADFEDPIAVEEGTWVNLANLSIGAVDYTWSAEGQNYTSFDFSHVFTLVGSNDIVLEATNEDCEEIKVKTIEVYAKTTGIKDAPELEAARVYGQDNQVVIDLTGVVTFEGYSARVFNLLGQEIETVELTTSITKIDVKDSGKYFLIQLVQGQTQKVFKVLLN